MLVQHTIQLQDDETGKFIPDITAYSEGLIKKSEFSQYARSEFDCRKHSDAEGCPEAEPYRMSLTGRTNQW